MKSTIFRMFVIILMFTIAVIIIVDQKMLIQNNIETEDIINNQWALNNKGQTIKGSDGKLGYDIDAIEAWNYTLGSKDVIVGVLDTGIEISNQNIKNAIFMNEFEVKDNGIDDDNNGLIDDVNGWDFYNFDNSIYDVTLADYHGTFIASLIGGAHKADGIWGIAPNIKILPLKFMEGSEGDITDAIKAINYAYSVGARIINCSWDSTMYDAELFEIMKKYDDVLFVCSSGKGHYDLKTTPVYPACFKLDNVICVSAVNNNGQLYELSGFGYSEAVYAPGKDILGTIPEGEFLYSDGTSFATAYVTGIAALIKSYRPEITVENLAYTLKSSNNNAKDNSENLNFYRIISAKDCIINSGLK